GAAVAPGAAVRYSFVCAPLTLKTYANPTKNSRVQAGNDGVRGPRGRPGGSGRTIDEECRWRGDASRIWPSTAN
ncbi:hypothetical protein BDFB_002500, partial [Asbolus verrucosus]